MNNKKIAMEKLALIASGFYFCTICKETKPVGEFGSQKGARIKIRSHCRKCRSEKSAAHNKNNFERVSKIQAAYRDRNKDKIKNYFADLYVKTKNKIDARNKAWHAANRESRSEKGKENYRKNRAAAYERRGRRRASEISATPRWLSFIQKAQVTEVYDIAFAREMQTGIKQHVDHIVPLRNKAVCGLHVPWNLQVLTADENLSKRNRFACP